jgi:hypothetical protein
MKCLTLANNAFPVQKYDLPLRGLGNEQQADADMHVYVNKRTNTRDLLEGLHDKQQDHLVEHRVRHQENQHQNQDVHNLRHKT